MRTNRPHFISNKALFRSSRSNGLVRLFLSIALFLFTGCARETASPPYRAEVLTMIPKNQNQSVSDDPQFQIKQVQFSFLEDLDTFTSKHYNLKAGGTLHFTQSWLSPGYSTVSSSDIETPRLHYSIQDGVVIPKDNFTLTILSTAYQFDTLFDQLVTLTGISPDDLLSSQGKLNIYHEVAIDHYDPEKSMTEGNAAYLSGMYSIATLKTSKDEQVPISMNLSVLTHEFGHLLMDLLIKKFKPLDFLEDYDLKGVNEGFADLFAFTLTGNSNVTAGSLDLDPSGPNRAHLLRDFTKINFDYIDSPKCPLGFYCIGVLFNHAYYKTMVDMNLDPISMTDRIQLLTQLIEAFKKSSYNVRQMIPFKKRTPESLKDSTYTRGSLELFLTEVLNSIDDSQFRNSFKKNLEHDFKPLLFEMEKEVPVTSIPRSWRT